MDEKAATRDRILQAAIARIKHYGYSKTTMAEIASDCDMSPGNIYRFFESKIDIAEAMVRRHYVEQSAEISAIARRRDVPVDRRMRQIFTARMLQAHESLHRDARLLEVAEILRRERSLIYKELQAAERAQLTALIEEGIGSGVFGPGDAAEKAEMLQLATLGFAEPHLLFHTSREELERAVNGVLDLVFFGLFDRPQASA